MGSESVPIQSRAHQFVIQFNNDLSLSRKDIILPPKVGDSKIACNVWCYSVRYWFAISLPLVMGERSLYY